MVGKSDKSYAAVAITSATVPVTVMYFCTWKVLMTLKRSRQRIEENISSMPHRYEKERRVTRILLAIIITYIIFNMPVCIFIVLR